MLGIVDFAEIDPHRWSEQLIHLKSEQILLERTSKELRTLRDQLRAIEELQSKLVKRSCVRSMEITQFAKIALIQTEGWQTAGRTSSKSFQRISMMLQKLVLPRSLVACLQLLWITSNS